MPSLYNDLLQDYEEDCLFYVNTAASYLSVCFFNKKKRSHFPFLNKNAPLQF